MSPCDLSEAQRAAVRLQWGVRIPLRDGVRLNGTLYLPAEDQLPAPVILTLTPYVAQTCHDYGIYFAAHGWPFLAVDVRGRGNSEGTFRPNLQEASDGHDVVEWIARQSYCNGKVAMWGGSYAGHAQWATARETPAHLSTIVPVASPCMGVDFPFRNNIAAPYLMQWLTLVAGRTSQDRIFWEDPSYWRARFRQWFESGLPFRALDAFLGMPSPIFQEWLGHPHRDAYWDRYNPTASQYERIALPILTITGLYDGDQPGALAHYRAHLEHASAAMRAQHHLVIGPWDHAGTRAPAGEFGGIQVGPAGRLDLRQLHLDWYAWTLRDGPKPAFLKQRVAYYVMGAERWRYADTLEAVTDHCKVLYLQAQIEASGAGNPTDVFRCGLLAERSLEKGPPSRYRHDPCDTALASLESTVDPESLTDQRMLHASRGRVLIYHTLPFTEDIEVSGFFRLSLWLSIDQPDTDFRAVVYAIDSGGRSVKLTEDILRARYRENARAEKLIRTEEPLRYDLAGFAFVSRMIRKGERLRLVVGPLHSIYSQRNHHSGGVVAEESLADARPVNVRLFHDVAHPSALHVPVGHPVDGTP